MEIAILIWIVCGIAAGVIASNRGGSGCLWFGLGILFGPFGLLFAFMAGDDRKCPHCKRGVAEGATRCPHCQGTIAAPEVEGGEHLYSCPHCRKLVSKGSPSCPSCGGAIGWPEKTPVNAPPPVLSAIPPPAVPKAVPQESRNFLTDTGSGVPMRKTEDNAPQAQSTKSCPFCAETILAAAKKCRYCGEFLNDQKIDKPDSEAG